MSNAEYIALQNAAAYSAMEGLPLEQRHFEIIQNILDGKLTLQEYLESLKKQYQEV